MKVYSVCRRFLDTTVNVTGCLLFISVFLQPSQCDRTQGPLGPSDRPEAYFNGSSYIRLSQPISLKQLVGLSFRTCVGGELFSQRFEGYTLHVTALFEQVVVSWKRPGQPESQVGLTKATLDNRWHWVGLRYKPNPPMLLLEVDKDFQVISNVTWNSELLTPGALELTGAVVLVGNVFSGCIHEGPQLEFHAPTSQERNVFFGHCPLTTDECKDGKDVLRIPPKDHCYNEPCMRHGTCISRHDRYECHCTARYTGNNCEVDAGDPCLPNPCNNKGRCVEDSRGDFSCVCLLNYHGAHCELEVSLDPLCVAGPCRNNGSCTVPPGADTYICTCPPGYTGRNCETDVDECVEGGGACLHGGRCMDAVNNYTCDCTDTGYTGARCEVNINECEEDRNICGHGVCYDTYGGFVCACQSGYTGERCHKMSLCASGPCGVGGACVEEGGGYRCVCARGLLPPRCTPPAPVSCRDLSCPTYSHCHGPTPPTAQGPQMLAGVMISKQVMCVCDTGYYGAPGLSPNCTTLDMACESGVCLNGATCLKHTDHFNCTCAPGYKGVYCELAAGKSLSDPPPERCNNAPCVHAASCLDTPTGFHCECLPGYSGVRCEVEGPLALSEGCGRGCGAGGVCREGADGPHCECRPPYRGRNCEIGPDCRTAGCPATQECQSSDGVWSCTEVDAVCASSPCHNGTCHSDNGLVRCVCPPGNNGRFCELDIDECALNPKMCNHGVCVNSVGSYQCYCTPGYTGVTCEQDIDECLSSPCKNGGTCQNLENNYQCTCVEGFEGKDCSTNINECESNPCKAGSTCVDGVATYSCVCQDGLTGAHCEIDIDDCESGPCQHGGLCADALNGYTCECTGTGYTGPECDVNIDECVPRPCLNGGTCRDELNDYRCQCFAGYTGKNCEQDINECESTPCQYGGVCLERSNSTLYRTPDSAPVIVGPQSHMLLPKIFYEPFSLETASGFECVCVAGSMGARCEINVDECATSPCGHGKCVDGVGEYTCDCSAGYEGDHCEIEIDECLRYRPCQHGRCFDQRAAYFCQCEGGWGGRNCSVVLEGCRESPCRNNGTCLPWLHRETVHRFNCSCAPGHYGTTCEKITTMSLEKASYAEVNTSRDEGYDISFRFKTTLGNGLLAMGRGLTYFFLELSNGRLNLHSSLLNKWEGVFIGSNLNDSNWQKVFVTINSSHLVLAANEEQTIYPISQNEAYNVSVTSFPVTRLGTAGSSYAPLTHGPNFFVGCFQDVVVNNQWVLPEDTESSSRFPELSGEGGEGAETGGEGVEGTEVETGPRALLRGVRALCPRRAQCAPSPCLNGGTCEDHWTTFRCTCPRPHLGDTCQYSYTAGTFYHESVTSPKPVVVVVSESARRAVHHALDISMFVRTRKPTGQIFYLGSGPKFGQTDETLVGASLKGGELLVHLRFNQTPEDYTVGGTRLDNGHLHLIEVVRNSTLVQVKLNGTEYFRKSISAAKQLDAQVLYLGGPPPPPPPPNVTESTLAPNDTAVDTNDTTPVPNDSRYFKGVIQDVQVSNGLNVSVVEFFPLSSVEVSGVYLPPSFGRVLLDPNVVLPGVVSDDVCKAGPCLHNATCTNSWNDYTCTCPRGYKGKTCAEVEFCQLQGCPLNSLCRSLDGGYECVSNATFDGTSTLLAYQLRVPQTVSSQMELPLPDTLTITYRSASGGTLFSAILGSLDISVGVYRSQVTVTWRSAPLPLTRRLHPPAHFTWTTIRLIAKDNTLTGAVVDPNTGNEEVGFTAPLDVPVWQRILLQGTIYLGGKPPQDVTTTAATTTPQSDNSSIDPSLAGYNSDGEEWATENSMGEFFKGCVGAVHVGGWLLPYFTEEQLFVGAAAALLAAQPHYALVSGSPWGAESGVGCVLCLERDCLHGGHCADVRSEYSCTCPPAYTGDHCEIDIDECVENKCENGATCQDGLASYTCICPTGFEGQFCESDIDECLSGPCGNGGRCVDVSGGFWCDCPPHYTGDTCLTPRRTRCTHHPCGPGTHRCEDVPPDPPTGNNYTCHCSDGYVGVHCESAFCEVLPCEHGTCVTTDKVPVCACQEGWVGVRCGEERDECETEKGEGGEGPCLHGGRCHDRHNSYFCDCTGTGWTGTRCETDVNECEVNQVNCSGGECLNLEGSYICICQPNYCGIGCALLDPCVTDAPCRNGGTCQQRCTDTPAYICMCPDGWAGDNCTQEALAGSLDGTGDTSSAVLIGVGAAVLLAALLAAGGGALAAQARRKRATRGTYSPSGQEYCNPRTEMMHNALKPPPEERLI